MTRRPLTTTGAARERRRQEVRHLLLLRPAAAQLALRLAIGLHCRNSHLLCNMQHTSLASSTLPPHAAGFGNPLRFTRHANAYMLVYVRESEWDAVMCQVRAACPVTQA